MRENMRYMYIYVCYIRIWVYIFIYIYRGTYWDILIKPIYTTSKGTRVLTTFDDLPDARS